MSYDRLFEFLFCCAPSQPQTFPSSRLGRIVDELGRLGYGVTLMSTIDDASSAVRGDAAIGCIVVEWSLTESENEVEAFVQFVREHVLNPTRCVLIVTHDARILEFADRVVHMEDGCITAGTEKTL